MLVTTAMKELVETSRQMNVILAIFVHCLQNIKSRVHPEHLIQISGRHLQKIVLNVMPDLLVLALATLNNSSAKLDIFVLKDQLVQKRNHVHQGTTALKGKLKGLETRVQTGHGAINRTIPTLMTAKFAQMDMYAPKALMITTP